MERHTIEKQIDHTTIERKKPVIGFVVVFWRPRVCQMVWCSTTQRFSSECINVTCSLFDVFNRSPMLGYNVHINNKQQTLSSIAMSGDKNTTSTLDVFQSWKQNLFSDSYVIWTPYNTLHRILIRQFVYWSVKRARARSHISVYSKKKSNH